MRKQLLEKANKLPLLPGVYIMRNAAGEVIYVGKAKKLKNRVSSYFHGEHLPKVAAMAEKVADFEVVVVNSEFEALMLELQKSSPLNVVASEESLDEFGENALDLYWDYEMNKVNPFEISKCSHTKVYIKCQ